MNEWLESLDGMQDIPLNAAMIVFGRHASCDICLDSVRVSRVHCCIYREGEQRFIRDLNSTNGVRINGQVVTKATFVAGDLLSIANLRFRCLAGMKVMDADSRHLEIAKTPKTDPELLDGVPSVKAGMENEIRGLLAGKYAAQYEVEVNVRLREDAGESPVLQDIGL